MSVSKLCSTTTGLYSGEHNINDERYTYRFLKAALSEMDKIIGYTERGGRGEIDFPEDSEERLKAYNRIGAIRKNPTYGVQTGRVKITVQDEDGNPLVAELRILPADEAARKGVTGGYTQGIKTRDARDIASEIYGAPYAIDPDSPYLWFDYFRRTTDEKGVFDNNLPRGKYIVFADKGSEYEIVQGEVTIPGRLDITLHRLIDMSKEGWYAGDLHHHSIFSSPAYPPQGTDFVYDTPETVQHSMRAKGLTFGALSDHHNVLNHRDWEKLVTPDFLPIISKEISTSNGHVLQLNTDPDVIYNIPPENEKTPEKMRAEFKRVTDEIKSYGGHPQINHPRDMQKSISFPPEFTDMIDIFKTIEIWNGSHPLMKGCTNGYAMELWLDLLEKGVKIGATTGSDTHEVTLEFWMDSLNYFFGMYLCTLAVVENTEKAHNPNGVTLTKEQLQIGRYIVSLLSEELPALNRWAHLNLSSGAVRTYVKAKGERTPENILKNLEAGNSFLTNGPILKAFIHENEAELTIISNRPLKKLYVMSSGRNTEEFSLADPEEIYGGFNYNCTVSLKTEGRKWFIFRVIGDDYYTEAITNPVMI